MPLPVHVERYTCCVVRVEYSTSCVLGELTRVLSQTNIEFDVHPRKFKVRAVAYDRRSALRSAFRVSIFEDGGSRVCEFQRRSGCTIFFQTLRARILTRLSHVLNPPSALPSSPRGVQPQYEIRTLPSDTLENVMDMASSPFSDVRVEGIRALALLSGEHSPFLSEYEPLVGVLTPIFEKGDAYDNETRYAALVIVGNLPSFLTLFRERVRTIANSSTETLDTRAQRRLASVILA